MTPDELATRWTIRLALVCSLAAAMAEVAAGTDERRLRMARAAWTAGWGLYLAHVACAFQFYHHWSHAAAYSHTALRTAELSGRNWGAGLYFNYVFTAAWTLDTFTRWRCPSGRRRARPPLIAWYVITWYGFFIFMLVNATIVFETGPVRWAALAGLAMLTLTWIKSRRARERIQHEG
jgi:hypothetical protein